MPRRAPIRGVSAADGRTGGRPEPGGPGAYWSPERRGMRHKCQGPVPFGENQEVVLLNLGNNLVEAAATSALSTLQHQNFSAYPTTRRVPSSWST